jgi:hypothetical protein
MRHPPANALIKTSSLLLVGTYLVTLALSVEAKPSYNGGGLSQAVVAYGYLRWDYQAFEELVNASASLSVVQDFKALDVGLESLRCDIPTRMAGPHRAMILPPSPTGQWFSFPRPGARSSPENGWLFVTQPGGGATQRVLVVFSTAAPEHTTVFWLDRSSDGRYSVSLLYDSSTKATVTNESTTIGAVTALRFENSGELLLKDWGEPGIGPAEFNNVRRVFRLNLSDGKVALAEPAKFRQR